MVPTRTQSGPKPAVGDQTADLSSPTASDRRQLGGPSDPPPADPLEWSPPARNLARSLRLVTKPQTFRPRPPPTAGSSADPATRRRQTPSNGPHPHAIWPEACGW